MIHSAVPEMKLELVPVPVSDVDRAKEFYVVQLTPPGSACAIVFGMGMGPIKEMTPGSLKGVHLVVDVQDMGGVKYAWFNAPDGNLWTLQEWPKGYPASV